MASDGLSKRAKKGTCRICQRSRNTDNQVKAVGEVRHGFATGHVWECIDTEECDKAAINRLENPMINGRVKANIAYGLESGRFSYYKILI